MSEWLNEAFSGGVSLLRVNPVGIAIMILSLVLLLAAKPISDRRPKLSVQAVKLAGLFICVLGTLIAIF